MNPTSDEETLFQAALPLAGAERAALLDRECAGNPTLRARLEALLAAHDQQDSLFRTQARDLRPPVTNRLGQGTSPAGVPHGHGIRDYELLNEIARGGTGVVYRARQKSLDRLVAVKTLLFGTFACPDALKRFRTEALAAAAIQHPNVVAIHEVGVGESEPYLVMEYVAGPSLGQLVKGRPLPPHQAARYLKVIAEAVHHLHQHGILHRDLKPSNVLIDARDQPRITDFGLAKWLAGDPSVADDVTQLTVCGQVMGSPAYMAPEQASGANDTVSVCSDVYALGATFYHLLTGRPPFGGDSISETLQQVQTQEPIPPRLLNGDVPLDLEAICLKCLEKDPADRYVSALLVAQELERFQNGDPILSRPAAPTRFGELRWTDERYFRRYLEVADYILPDRQRLWQVLRCFFRHHLAGLRGVRVCDLGCGDGALAAELLAVDPTLELTLLEGSSETLALARKRFPERPRTTWVEATFEAIIRREVRLGPFDFIASSFAIHHLHHTEKAVLFQRLLDALQPGGWFMNLDVTLPDQEGLTAWWIELWREQILEAERRGASPRSCRDAPEESFQNPDNKYATLGLQLKALRAAGFREVECHYRNGLFGIYSGRKPLVSSGQE